MCRFHLSLHKTGEEFDCGSYDAAFTIFAVGKVCDRRKRLEDAVRSLSCCKTGVFSMSSVKRQHQFASAEPGKFIRASEPKLSKSCKGAIASPATEHHAMWSNSASDFAAIAVGSIQIAPDFSPFRLGMGFEPSASCIVIMRSRIHHGVGRIVRGEMRVIRTSIKGELKHSCSGNMELIAQRANIRRDQTEILSDKWQRV